MRNFCIKHIEDEYEDKQPSCIWALAHVLNYHHWHFSIRKRLHQGRYSRRKRAKSHQRPKANLFQDDDGEVENRPSEKNTTLISSTKNARYTNKRSLGARLKELIAEDDNKQRQTGPPFEPKLQRTFSIHHLEAADESFGKLDPNWKHHIIFLPNNVGLRKTRPSDTNTCSFTNDMKNESLEHLDVLELLKVDKKLFSRLSEKRDENIVKATSKLTKSGTFPGAALSHGRKLRPIKLENKHKEAWSFLKGDKNVKDIDGRWERDRDGNKRFVSSSGVDEDDSIQRATFARRKSLSLNESVDRYTRLFENSYGKEAKLYTSRSLRLTSEYGVEFKKIRSLTDVDSYFSHEFEVPGDEFSAEESTMAVNDGSLFDTFEDQYVENANNSEKRAVDEGNNIHVMQDVGTSRFDKKDGAGQETEYFMCEVENPQEGKSDMHKEMEDDYPEIMAKEVLRKCPFSDSDNCSQEMESASTEFQISKGLVNHDDHFYMETSLPICSPVERTENTEDRSKYMGPYKDDSDMSYVKLILSKSGFTSDAFDIVWHSRDEPLSPQLFEQIEAQWHDIQEPDGSDFYGCWHHQMLFDLVNDALVELYCRLFTYYPKALSCTSRVHLLPVGNHIVEEVWKSVDKVLNIKVEHNESLDCIVANDLANDSWMNLRIESEEIALELEDVLFEELLEEIFV